jgi:predicted membrane protein
MLIYIRGNAPKEEGNPMSNMNLTASEKAELTVGVFLGSLAIGLVMSVFTFALIVAKQESFSTIVIMGILAGASLIVSSVAGFKIRK